MDTSETLFEPFHTFEQSPFIGGKIEVSNTGVEVFNYYHSCGSTAYINCRQNPKGNRYYCDKCGLVKKSEVTLKNEQKETK